MSCGKKSRPRRLLGPDAAEWYRDHRCDTDPQTDCWQWRKEHHDTIEYLKRRYNPEALMFTLLRQPPLTSEERPAYSGIVTRPPTCTFDDCINPDHLELITKEALIKRTLDGEFWSPAMQFEWQGTVHPPEPGESGGGLGLNCRVRNFSCHVGSRFTWNYYALKNEALAGFSAEVQAADGFTLLFRCEGFEHAKHAKAFCEAVIRGDSAEIVRLEDIAAKDLIAQGDADYAWVDYKGFTEDDVDREVSVGIGYAVESLFELWAKQHQTAPSDQQAEFWNAVINRGERAVSKFFQGLPAVTRAPLDESIDLSVAAQDPPKVP